MEADHRWRCWEGDWRHGTEVADVVELEVRVCERQSLPAFSSVSLRARLAREWHY
jgi:hypothetical protein